MLGRRMGRGGLVRAAATTAVVAGTATAVSGRVQDRRYARGQQAADAEAYQQQQQQAEMNAAAQQAAYAAQMAAPPAPAQDEMMTQLQNLATLHSQGILSDAEFAAGKAKLLS
jgi:malonyl CoA-acyl carrier protein transacylase